MSKSMCQDLIGLTSKCSRFKCHLTIPFVRNRWRDYAPFNTTPNIRKANQNFENYKTKK